MMITRFAVKMENVNRSKVDTLDELTSETCYYISKDHLVGEINTLLTQWKKDFADTKNQYVLFFAYLEDNFHHSLLIYATIYHKMFPNPDITKVVGHLLEFIHHGNTNWLKKHQYCAAISLSYFDSLAECQRAIKKAYNLDVPNEFTSLDIYPVEGARKVRLFQGVESG